MIFDSHAHVFPPLGTAPGWSDPAGHRRMLQLYIAGHHQPVRRLADHALAPWAECRDFEGTGTEPLPDVGFRVGAYGRFEWTIDSVDYYRQFLPPSLQTMESPIDYLLQEMAAAGVDRAVLQNARIYGKLEEHIARAVAAHPDRFVGLAGVDEPSADTEDERAALAHAVRDLGLRGVYVANRGFHHVGYARSFDDPRYEPYWAEIEHLGAVVFWEIAGVPLPTTEAYLREIDRLNRWAGEHRGVRCVLTHGFPATYLEAGVPEPIAELLANERFLVEVLYPIGVGGRFDYPYEEVRPAIRELYGRVGGRRLIWGSDMPNVARHCTYRQSLEYLAKSCRFIPPSDMERITGGNLEEVFG